jgi:hypothetical protein
MKTTITFCIIKMFPFHSGPPSKVGITKIGITSQRQHTLGQKRKIGREREKKKVGGAKGSFAMLFYLNKGGTGGGL